jgi:two-component system, OmpR family, phosphate regulon response regulator PhoB
MTARVLVVESNDPPTLLLRDRVEEAGFSVAYLIDDEAVTRFECRRNLDLLILHWDLPCTPHIALSKLLRAQFQIERIAVAIFAHLGADGNAIRDVPVGVHEHIAQPLPFTDLFTRVKALAMQTQQPSISDMLVAGELVLDRRRHAAFRGQRALRLSLAPCRLLEFLMSNPGRVFTRRQLVHALWGYDSNVDERTIDVEVGRIRGAMNRGRDEDPIRTVRGGGYAFAETFGFDAHIATKTVPRPRSSPSTR